MELDAILAEIPADFHPFVEHRAWESGHSAGYEEVVNYARELVYELKPCIKQYDLGRK